MSVHQGTAAAPRHPDGATRSEVEIVLPLWDERGSIARSADTVSWIHPPRLDLGSSGLSATEEVPHDRPRTDGHGPDVSGGTPGGPADSRRCATDHRDPVA